MKQRIKFIFTTWFIAISLFTINAQDVQTNKNDMENLNLTNEWDKTFPQSDKVKHSKVTFRNRYGITLAADLYMPKNAEGKLPAIAVCGPFGAVKEQASGLYAQIMAERGFLTIAFDPSFTGESGGAPRYVASPDINTEDFCAAVDFLSLRDDVDSERIGIIGICGWGGLAINAAAIDTRIKATVASTMYDMSRCTANGYFDENDNADARYEMAYQRRLSRHKAQYSLDCDDGIEYSACLHEPTPQELLERMETFLRLWNALNSLPEIQGRRIDAHIILGKSIKEIAEAEGVHEESIRQSIKRGLERMKKIF